MARPTRLYVRSGADIISHGRAGHGKACPRSPRSRSIVDIGFRPVWSSYSYIPGRAEQLLQKSQINIVCLEAESGPPSLVGKLIQKVSMTAETNASAVQWHVQRLQFPDHAPDP